jgi:hypothetical protein
MEGGDVSNQLHPFGHVQSHIFKIRWPHFSSFLLLARRTNITEDKIVLRYEKIRNKLDLLSFFNSVLLINR